MPVSFTLEYRALILLHAMHYFLRYSLLVFGLTSSSLLCSDKLAEDWMEANVAVQASVRRIFSRVLNNSTIANDSLSTVKKCTTLLQRCWAHLSHQIGLANYFQEIIIEIIAAKIATCPDSKSSQLGVNDVSILVTNLIVDGENIKQVMKNFGKLLCLQSARNISNTKPQADLVEKFYDSINGDQLATICAIIWNNKCG